MSRQSSQYLVLLAVLFAMTGCVTTGNFVVGHDPLLDQNGGVFLIVDSCILRDAVNDTDDCYVVAESKATAQALVNATRKYLSENGVPVRAAITPFTCGALLTESNSPQKVADRIDGNVTIIKQPFCVENEFSDDQEYMDALTKLSTYSFQKAMAVMAKREADRKFTKAPTPEQPCFINTDEFNAAVSTVLSRTGASSVLYIGLLGNSRTSGKAVAQGVGDFFVGMATGLATGGMLIITPQHNDVSLLCANSINLASAECIWSNAINVVGDPVKSERITQPHIIQQLLFDLTHKSKEVKSTEQKW
jgi:hypothetical protein